MLTRYPVWVLEDSARHAAGFMAASVSSGALRCWHLSLAMLYITLARACGSPECRYYVDKPLF